MRTFKPTYLYIKTHNKTGLKYFGKTIEHPSTYPGSGLYWTRHLKIHGDDVTTEIYGYYIDPETLHQEAVAFSKNNNIVESKNWANLRPETGFTGGDTSDSFTNEARKKISERNKGVNNPQSKLTKSQVIEIYHSMNSPEELSTRYGVGTGQIFGIKRKIYYKDITASISGFPGQYTGKKKIRYIIPIDAVVDIFLKEETYDYFKKKYNASRQVVKNIKLRKVYKTETEGLVAAGSVKKYKLTNQDTVDIFRSCESNKNLASRYGVSVETIRNIKNGDSRKFFKDEF